MKRLWLDVWEYAGVIGIDPSGFTYRELFVMYHARERSDCEKWASLFAMLANVFRGENDEVKTADDFNPYKANERANAKKPMLKVLSVFDLKKVMFKRKRQK